MTFHRHTAECYAYGCMHGMAMPSMRVAESERQIAELKPCPCGKVPERLSIMDGSTYRWRYVGCPCDEWWIEASVRYADRNDADAIYALCVDAWNAAPRSDKALEGT